jgi:uncharacterized protein (DUF934 family)
MRDRLTRVLVLLAVLAAAPIGAFGQSRKPSVARLLRQRPVHFDGEIEAVTVSLK